MTKRVYPPLFVRQPWEVANEWMRLRDIVRLFLWAGVEPSSAQLEGLYALRDELERVLKGGNGGR